MRSTILVIASVVAVIVLGLAARSAIQAKARLDTANIKLLSVQHAAAEVERLRVLPVAAALEKRPEPGIVGHLTASLSAAGLPSSLMTSFNPGSDAPHTMEIPGAGTGTNSGRPSDAASGLYRRQEARFTLEPLTLPELGRFLKSWREQHPEWTCATIEIVPASSVGSSRETDSAVKLRASVGIQAVYLAQGGS